MKLKKKFVKILTVSLVGMTALGLAGCGSQQAMGHHSTQPESMSETYASASSSKLANLKYHSGKSAVVKVNNDRAKLNPRWTHDHVQYTNLDHENRTSHGNTGWLDSNNVASDSLRTRQIVKPTGWHQKFINNEAIINRGHEIAYSLSKGINQEGQYKPGQESGDQNNPKNLFTQTAFSNQELQTIYESKVRNALRQGKKVVYKVQPVFKGSNEMASGVHMQAISSDHSLDFNVYLFNVQPGVIFNYRNGRSTVDHNMRVPKPAGAPTFHDNDQGSFYNRYNGGYRRSYYNRGYHHHFIRHYAEYRLARHMVRHHYMRKYGYRRYGYRRYGYRRHSFFHRNRYGLRNGYRTHRFGFHRTHMMHHRF